MSETRITISILVTAAVFLAILSCDVTPLLAEVQERIKVYADANPTDGVGTNGGTDDTTVLRTPCEPAGRPLTAGVAIAGWRTPRVHGPHTPAGDWPRG